ncbi:PP2C family protein-serine/threonine phosphatase [Streptomyces sp. NPDC014872]|uniref:PP2C family protein-serine/threonine phosphatase n=1 Tax=Streptomyces sp. NPDC014872 TaxID=3364926 RepID=UPI0036FA46C7
MMAGRQEEPEQPHIDLRLRLDRQLDQIAAQLRELATAKDRLQGLLNAVLAISQETDLPAVLHRIVTTAKDLVGARYGALGVLDESGEQLEQFITAGLSESERNDLADIELPRGRGVLGHLIHHPEPLRVDDIRSHPASVGFPPGHPRMRTLLGVAISVRGTIYGDLYMSERRDGQPFDRDDEDIVVALAGAAGIAIENVSLFEQVRTSAEHFQRLLLPTLPDLRPFTGAAIYRPAPSPGHLGGDWYDALWLPDHTCAVVIGDVVGHDLRAAAAMAQTRSMLRALLYDRLTPPSSVLAQLDRTLHDITDLPVATACLARIEPAEDGWRLHWSTAGHLPPLLIGPDGHTKYLHAEPGLPLAVNTDQSRPDHIHPVPAGATVVFFTDGLVEHRGHSIDHGLAQLAELAAGHVRLPLDDFVHFLADRHPSDGHDDLAILALRTPPAIRRAHAGANSGNGRTV